MKTNEAMIVFLDYHNAAREIPEPLHGLGRVQERLHIFGQEPDRVGNSLKNKYFWLDCRKEKISDAKPDIMESIMG